MFNMNQFTEEERNIVSRCCGKNEKALARNIRRMIPCLPVSELEPALSAVEKLESSREESRTSRAADRAAGFALDRLTALRGWFLLGSSSQLHCFPV